MATSLAQQLKKLQVPQTSLLLQDKQRKSLLFDPREAADIDKDTVYAIGVTGLEELELLDPAFSEYHKTIFAESSKHLERSVCTAEANQQLNNAISCFLRASSPYFLLRPVHKAMEWLIYRFHIELYNVNDVLACILPFHETRIFVRTVQLFDLSDPTSRWHWLMPLQKPGIPLPKSTLVTHCAQDLSFMRFICDLVPKYMEVRPAQSVNQPLISFYVVTVLGALEYCNTITEEMLNCLLPYILRGLKSSCIEYCAATYMILCQIATRSTLSSDIVDKLLSRMAQYLHDSLIQEFCMCLLIIFQHQDVKKIPQKVFSLIKGNASLQDELEKSSGKFQTSQLIHPLLISLIKQHLLQGLHKDVIKGKVPKLINRIVSGVEIGNQTVKKVVCVLFKMYIKHCKSANTTKKLGHLKSLRKNCLFILGVIERKYPMASDHAVESFLDSCKPDQGILVQTLLSTSARLPEHQLVKGTSTPLFLALNHPSYGRRKAAVQTLLGSIKNAEVEIESSFVRESVLQRLRDDNPKVVKAVLALKENLFRISPTDVPEIMFKILNTSSSTKWSGVKENILSLVCNESNGIINAENTVAAVLPFLFPKDTFKFIKIIMSSQLSQTYPLLTHLSSDCKELLSTLDDSEDDFIKWTATFISSLKNMPRTIPNLHSLAELLSSAQSNTLTSSFSALLLFQQIIPHERDLKKVVTLCHSALHLVQKMIPFYQAVDDSPAAILASLNESQFPISLVSSSLMTLIHAMPKDNTDVAEIKLELFGFLSSKHQPAINETFSVISRNFFEYQFESAISALKFLSSSWADHFKSDQIQEKNYQLASLLAAEKTLSSVSAKNPIIEHLLMENSLELLSLFLSLLCSDVGVRTAGMKCLQNISAFKPKTSNPLHSLIVSAVERSEEILADESQFLYVLSSWLALALEPSKHAAQESRRLTVVGDWLSLCCQPETPPHIQYGTMCILRFCQGEAILSKVLPLCKTILDAWEPVGLMENLPYLSLTECLSKWNPSVVLLLSKTDAQSVVLLKRALCSKVANLNGGTIQEITLKVITKPFFEGIPSAEVQKEFLELVLNLYLECQDGENRSDLMKTLQKMCGKAQLLDVQLQLTNPNRNSGDLKQSVKDIRKLRSSVPVQEDQLQNKINWKESPWPKVTVLLEVLLSLSQEPESSHILLSPLFELLKCALEGSSEGGDQEVDEGREYILQLLLSCIQTVVSSPMFPVSTCEEFFQVDLVVQCVRVTRHPQTQNQAHMLLNVAGQLFPERVLHSVMSVFTFMGSSLLRKEDNFSFQVVVQTVDTIVPALLKANVGHREDSDLDKVCAAVTRVFVDAVFDIPSQRRLPVFCRLVSALGAKKNLWIPLVQLVDATVLKHHVNDDEKSVGSLSPAVQFAVLFSAEFSPSVQVHTILKVLEFLSALPLTKEEWIKQHSKSEPDVTLQEFLDIRNYSELKLLHFKYTAATLLCYILSSESFLAKIIEVKAKHVPKLELCYRKILECLLLYIQNMSAGQANMLPSNPKLAQKFLHRLYDLLDKVTSLLPSAQFLSVVELLGDHPLASVRRKALEMLNAKLLNQPKFFKEEDHVLLLAMLKPLVKIAKGRRRSKSSSTNLDKAEDRALNQQTALISILCLSKLLGDSHPGPFDKVLGSISVLFQQQIPAVEHHAQLVSNIVLCLAELCSCLRAHALPHLSTFMPPLLQLLENEEILFRNNFLLVSTVTAVQRLVENLSAFLSSYLPVLLMQIICFSSHVQEQTSLSNKVDELDSKHKPLSILEQRLNNICSHISTAVPGRVLLPAVEQCYQKMFIENKHKPIGVLMSVLRERISKFEKSELTALLPALKNFFLTALDFRNQLHGSGHLLPQVNDIEGQILEAMLTLVLKLSETSFRPFFYQVYEWGTQEENDTRFRIITFYRFTEMMAVKLKTLFVLFGNHFVKNSADVLNNNNLSKTETLPWGNEQHGEEQSCQLLNHLLATLHSCFLHDTQHTLVVEEYFKSLSQPLVDQLENTVGGEDKYQERITNLLSPCLAQLAVAAADDSCWKPYQYQILLKTRHADAKIRFAALKSLQELATKLGDDYVTLLPEAIPFLAELLEDESSEVEQQCQEVLSKMEQIVGEPLKKYF